MMSRRKNIKQLNVFIYDDDVHIYEIDKMQKSKFGRYEKFKEKMKVKLEMK